jgi:predicted SprT family Zn-dependent metalloprotease
LGEYEPDPHVIRISEAKNGHLDTVIKTVAHEIIHMRLHLKHSKSWDKHDKSFTDLSHKVAITLGFDPKEL